jgi:hypothetical protein
MNVYDCGDGGGAGVKDVCNADRVGIPALDTNGGANLYIGIDVKV